MERFLLSTLDSWKNSVERKPLVLLGARQVGKTFLLNQFAKSFKNYHYFDFEKQKNLHSFFENNLEPLEILNRMELLLNVEINLQTDLIIFDEIQACSRALTSLKYFCQELPTAYIASAGSLLGLTLNDNSFPVGKVELVNLYPLSFDEFLIAIGEERLYRFINTLTIDSKIENALHEKLWALYKEYLVVGGLPEVVVNYAKQRNKLGYLRSFDESRALQGNLYKMYLADMAKHAGKINAMHLQRVWDQAAIQLSQDTNGAADKFKFGGVVPGVQSYARLAGAIDWITMAGLVIKVPIVNQGIAPLRAYTKDNVFKLFIVDIGLLGAMIDLKPAAIMNYDFKTYKGFFVENYVAQEFYAAGIKPIYCWRENTAEIQFIFNYKTSVIPVEVKSGWKVKSKSLTSFSQKYSPDIQIILSANNLELNLIKKTWHVPLYLASKILSISSQTSSER